MGEGVSAMFSDYEREFSSALAAASRKVESSTSDDPAISAATSNLDDADRDLGEASELLQSMALEAGSLSGAARSTAGARLETLRADAAAAKATLRAARIGLAKRRGDADRKALLGDRKGDPDLEAGISEDERAQLAATTRKLQDGSERIMDSRRSIAQTESIASNILSDLAAQRATIQRARNNLGGVDDGLDQSNNILAQMNRRAMMNKLVIYAIFAFISIVILCILYSKVFGKRG